MSLDLILCVGVLLTLFGVPSVMAAWSDARPILLRMAIPLAGLGLLAYVSLRAPASHGPDQWIQAVLRVISSI